VPKDNEVVIRVRAASVNPLDWRMKSQRPGVDVAGEVVAVGAAATQFKPGDALLGAGKGTFAEYACAPDANLVPKPEGMAFDQAAALPIAGLTALQGLRDKGHLQPGQKVLINGAAGGIGTFAVQIAKSLGANVTGVCSTQNVELVRSLGADRVIDYTRDDFTQDNQRYDLLLDNVGNRSLSDMRRILTPNGKCVMAGAPKSLWATLTRVSKAFVWSLFAKHKFTFFIARIKREDLKTLCALIEARKITPVIDRLYPLSETAVALAYVETGHARAKVVITFQ
jgi:NADPH:quinone reductase-like Zn-dependent oxidoreductase